MLSARSELGRSTVPAHSTAERWPSPVPDQLAPPPPPPACAPGCWCALTELCVSAGVGHPASVQETSVWPPLPQLIPHGAGHRRGLFYRDKAAGHLTGGGVVASG